MAKEFQIKFISYGIVNTILAEDTADANRLISIITEQGQHPCVWLRNAGYDKVTGKCRWTYGGANSLVTRAHFELFGIEEKYEVAYLKDGKKVTHTDTKAVCEKYFAQIREAGLPVYVTCNGRVVMKANLQVKADAGQPVQA